MSKYTKPFLFFLTLLSASAFAQTDMSFLTVAATDSLQSPVGVLPSYDGYIFGSLKSTTKSSTWTAIKTDSAQNTIWSKKIDAFLAGGILCPDSGYLFSTVAPAFAFYYPTIIFKTDKDLNIRWVKKLDNPTYSQYAYMSPAVATKDNYYLVGSAEASDIGLCCYNTKVAIIIKMDTSGTVVNQTILADTASNSGRLNYYFPTLSLSADSNLYMTTRLLPYWAAGTSLYTEALIKIDTSLNVKWANKHAPFGSFSILPLKDGSIGLNVSNCFQKVDSSGKIIFTKYYYHTTPVYSEGTTGIFIELQDSSIFLSRQFTDTMGGLSKLYFQHVDKGGKNIKSVRFDLPYNKSLGSGMAATERNSNILLSRLNNADTILFMKIDTSLNFGCYSAPNDLKDSSASLSTTSFSPVRISYPFYFIDTVYSSFQNVIYTFNKSDVCIQSLIETPVRYEHAVSIYPNPASEKVIINCQPHSIIEVYNLFGERMSQTEETQSTVPVDISSLNSGIYLFKIYSANEVYTFKIIKINN